MSLWDNTPGQPATRHELDQLVAAWEAGGRVGPDPRSRAGRFARGEHVEPVPTSRRTLPGMPIRTGRP